MATTTLEKPVQKQLAYLNNKKIYLDFAQYAISQVKLISV